MPAAEDRGGRAGAAPPPHPRRRATGGPDPRSREPGGGGPARARSRRPLVLALVLLSAVACTEAPAPVGPDEDLVARLGLEPVPPMPHPDDNPPDPAKIALGKTLFFDPVLSGPKDVACATCHHPDFAMTDGRDLPIGAGGEGLGPDRVRTLPQIPLEARNAPTIVNAGFNRFAAQVTADGFMFWDGRVRRIERLAILPLAERSEMRGDAYPPHLAVDSVMARLRAIPEYRELFRAAFPARAAAVDRGELASVIDSLPVVQALSQFARSLTGTESPYDRFVAGDADALTARQKQGLLLFHGKAGCVACHSGPLFSDFRFHVVGARQQGPGFRFTPHEDFGRWNVTELESDRWAFRTPSLRNVAETGPYMHAGGYPTLREAVALFLRGGGDEPSVPRDRLDPALRPRNLTAGEVDALVAFLESLTDLPEVTVPDRVPSGLSPAGVR